MMDRFVYIYIYIFCQVNGSGVMFWLLALPLKKQCFLFPTLLFFFPLLSCLGRTEATSHSTPLLLEQRPINLLVSHIGSM